MLAYHLPQSAIATVARRLVLLSALAGAMALPPVAAEAQVLTEPGDRGAGPRGADQPAEAETSDRPAQQERQSSVGETLPRWLADPGGVRASLEASGVNYLATYIGEGLTTLRGGQRRGSIGAGRLDFQFEVDFAKSVGLELILHTNIYATHGKGLSGCCVGNILVVSGLEAVPQLRLYELWLEKQFLGDRVTVRAGQLAADTEFLVSQYAGLFVNTSFGWPASTAAGMPNGGPAYPTATPGVRLKISPTDNVAFLLAAFNGDPVGRLGSTHPQRRDRSGLEFRTSDPANLMGEVSYAYGHGTGRSRLPGLVKFGGWYHLGGFRDLRHDVNHISLANPDSTGDARRRRGNGGVYAVLDQLLYRHPALQDGGIGFFARLTLAPEDRNVVTLHGDAGLTFKGFVPGRPRDTFGIAVGYAAISNRLRALDRDALGFGLPNGPTGMRGVRASETLLEATYQAELGPGVTLQPSLQFIGRPGATRHSPRSEDDRLVKNALVGGLRATIRY